MKNYYPPCLEWLDSSLVYQPHLRAAAVERLFGGVGKDFAKQRQGMTEQTLEEIAWARYGIKQKYKDE